MELLELGGSLLLLFVSMVDVEVCGVLVCVAVMLS